MSDRATILRLAKKLARQNARRQNARLKKPSHELDLAREIKTRNLRPIPPALWDELDALLDHNPSLGFALARVLHTIAKQKRSARLRAQADLALIRALNGCGEFKQTLALCPAAARRFEKSDDTESVARVWLEAAWAHTFLGDLNTARALLVQVGDSLHGENQLRQQWIHARLLREQGEYRQAADQFAQLRAQWHAVGAPLQAARCQREQGHAYVRLDTGQAQQHLDAARAVFVAAGCPIEIALCDYFSAYARVEHNDYPEALTDAQAARSRFVAQGLPFFVAWSDLEIGFIRLRLNDYAAAVTHLTRAWAQLLACGAVSDASACEINLGAALNEQSRHDEAVGYLEQAARHALALGQRTKSALCFVNIGWARIKQGRFADALTCYAQARAEYERARLALQTARFCDVNEGLVYLLLGQFAQARVVLEHARQVFQTKGLRTDLAECESYLAQIYAAQGQRRAARRALEIAHALYIETRQPVFAALCDREMAHLAIQTGDLHAARKHLAASRRSLTAVAQPIESALCDLETAELALAERKLARAARLFAAARQRFDSGMPDLAWRAEYGMGRVAQARGAPTTALTHYRAAVAQIALLRGTMGTEQFSNTFFEARRQVYAHALRAAYAQHDTIALLEIIEAAKARLLSVLLARREWRPSRKPGNRMEQELYARQMELRGRLERLQGALMGQAPSTGVPLPRGGMVDSRNAMRELRATREEYEQTIAQLSVMRQGLEGAPDLAPFSLQEFRAAAHARWGTRWAGLTYCFTREGLLIVGVDAEKIFAQRVRLSRQDKFLLEQYCDTRRDLRELRYRGTLHGIPHAQNTAGEWNALTELLMPAAIRQRTDEPTLLISPHGQLHQFPFHALRDEQGYLLERFGFLYAPTLQVWTQLNAVPKSTTLRTLLCGVEDFGTRARPLPLVRAEVRALQATGKGNVTTLWGQHATRGELIARNAGGALRKFDVLHFATHAVFEPRTPHWSRILLADQELSTADILDLRLNARLVTLSACSTALGTGGQGDEWVALARAFFYAGARTVVATQWEVEDRAATRDLMVNFYHRLARGATIAEALRQAQLCLLHQGAPPFHWAAYTAVGAE